MLKRTEPPTLAEMRALFRTFCQKHRIRRFEVFGSVAHSRGAAASDVELLVTPDETHPPTTTELLEMAREAEELVGAPVDLVLRPSLEKSPNRFARDHILATAVCEMASGCRILVSAQGATESSMPLLITGKT